MQLGLVEARRQPRIPDHDVGVGDPIRITGDSAMSIAIIYYLALLVGVFSVGWVIHLLGKAYEVNKPLPLCIALPGIPFVHSGFELGEVQPINTGLGFSDAMLGKYSPDSDRRSPYAPQAAP